MQRVTILALTLLMPMLASCAAGPDVQARKEYWEERLNLEVPIGSSTSQLLEWLASQDLDHHITRPEDEFLTGVANSIVFSLEKIEGDGWVCGFWLISGRAIIEESRIQRYEFSQDGSCL